jgi:hypothetical protein
MGWRSGRGEPSRPGRLLRRVAFPLTALILEAGAAAGDHGAGLRAPGFGPTESALVYGGLVLVLGVVVALVVAVFTRRPDAPRPEQDSDE